MEGGDRDRGGVDRVPLMSNFTKLFLFVRLFYFIFVHDIVLIEMILF